MTCASITELNVLAISFREVRAPEGQKFFAPTHPVWFSLGEGTPGVVPWGASAYEDDGTANRLNLCVRVDNPIVSAVRNLEARVKSALELPRLNSCLKEDVLRLKVWMDEAHDVFVWNGDGELVSRDKLRTLQNTRVNVMVELRGVYVTEHGSGLVLDAVDVLIGGSNRPTPPWI
jgi:hypothetical protein